MVNRLQNMILFEVLHVYSNTFYNTLMQTCLCQSERAELPAKLEWCNVFRKCVFTLCVLQWFVFFREGQVLGWVQLLSLPLCGDVLQWMLNSSYRQWGSALASFPSPMVFLVLEENVHSVRDVTLLSRQWNINCDANWKKTAFYVLWNEAIYNPRIGCKSIWEFNQEFNVAVPRQKCYQTPREFEYSGMSKAFEWFGGK